MRLASTSSVLKVSYSLMASQYQTQWLEVAVQVNYSIEDPTFPSQYYGPGVTVGQFITDGRGNFEAWTNGFIAENNGPIPTQVFEVYAQYGALKSQPIYLYV